MKNALISVSDKRNLYELAQTLIKNDYVIYATGKTYTYLMDKLVTVHKVESLTKYPEMMDGRVKTLHPKIHGGILGKRNNASHCEDALRLDIPWIDLVVVNLYPFKETVMDQSKIFEEVIEQIDIGGTALIRSAAKNFQFVDVLVDPDDYTTIMNELNQHQTISQATKKRLAAKAFNHTAHYDALIAAYFNEEEFPQKLSLPFEKKLSLRYGENPHQNAAFYINPFSPVEMLNHYEPLHGKALSYNNIIDIDAAIKLLRTFNKPTAVVLKHTNPCGVASAIDITTAFKKAHEADPISIFGGIVALNETVHEELAHLLNALFLEIIIAKDFSEAALMILSKKKNIRLIKANLEKNKATYEYKSVENGLLVQQSDELDSYNLEVLTTLKPSEEDIKQLLFAYKVVKSVKSNAIVIAKNEKTLGIGAGQMSRVLAAHIALNQASNEACEAYMASDGFFPMPDSIEHAKTFNIKAIIQPAGSIKDQTIIDACNKHGIIMVKTGIRHFKH
ncbi:MAG: bifunctional phosphoribosylaminoimidazolecarboxamide formyltransferase/IMP cyclohydrolase [Candidatus Izemoplasmataceae bacterium]